MSFASARVPGMVGGTTGVTRRNAAIRALQGAGPLIYAVRTADDLVKIGISTDVVARLHKIHGGTAEILALVPGDLQFEAEVHEALRGHAKAGREYYYPTPAVNAMVNKLRARVHLEPIDLSDARAAWRSRVWGD